MKRLLFPLTLCAALVSCKTTPVTPTNFYQAVVTCTESNTANPQAEAAVVQCLTDAVAGDYAGCLSGLVAGGTWTVDEVACIVRSYATTAAVRINAGTATKTDSTGLANANAWLKSNQVQFHRTSP